MSVISRTADGTIHGDKDDKGEKKPASTEKKG